jgi:hypothetical protein
VYKWALESVDLDTEDALILKNQEVDGKALLDLTEEKLQKILPLGPAIKLSMAIKAMKNEWAKRIACMRSIHIYFIIYNNDLLLFVCQH